MSELAASLLLLHLPDTGGVSYWKLVDEFGSASEALRQPLARLQPLLRPKAHSALRQHLAEPERLNAQVEADLAYLASHSDIHCLMVSDAHYPELLRQIPCPPPLLYVRGEVNCLSLPQLAIVGSRNPSSGGGDNAQQFAAYLAEAGFAITSGLALGVDAAAHRGALTAGGKTLAVMGTGIDRIYPARHRALAQQILDNGGTLVSEFPLATNAHAGNFPQRNRIISGLSLGTLVVEAALQSGSLITASFALQQNREVFAIPGSIHNPLARGCHQLIRQGAKLVETGQDIIEELTGLLHFQWQQCKPARAASVPEPAAAAALANLAPSAELLLNALGYDPVAIDVLVERTSLAVGDVAAQLVALELQGAVLSTPNGYARAPGV